MPYIIYVPGVPQPYVTNDPRIYIDCLKLFKWECESRPFHDAVCKAFRAEEDQRFLADGHRDQLQAYCIEEIQRQAKSREGCDIPEENASIPTEEAVERLAEHDLNQRVLSDIKEREYGAL